MDDFEHIRQLVDNIRTKNMVDANLEFNNVISNKVQAALDVKRQELASSIFGGAAQETADSTDDVDVEVDQ